MLVHASHKGYIKCPSNFTTFCDRITNCENMCNLGGICINKKCYCNPGFTGTSCTFGKGLRFDKKSQTCQELWKNLV